MPLLTPARKHLMDRGLNVLLILCLLIAGSVFLGYTTGYGMLLAPVGWAVALGVFLRWRWAYFASAVWALACYQLAKEGLDFELLKRVVMMLSVPLVVLSIYLHEVLGRRRAPANSTDG